MGPGPWSPFPLMNHPHPTLPSPHSFSLSLGFPQPGKGKTESGSGTVPFLSFHEDLSVHGKALTRWLSCQEWEEYTPRLGTG
jgi:hypothetical protein